MYKFFPLPLPKDMTQGFPNAINDAGDVAGACEAGDGLQLASFWPNVNAAVKTGQLIGPGLYSFASAGMGVNGQGVVAAFYEDNLIYPFVWEKTGGTVTQLDTGHVPQTGGKANGINDAGEITGSTLREAANNSFQAITWNSKSVVPVTLGLAEPEQDNSMGNDINRHGIIVGSQTTGDPNLPVIFTWDPAVQKKVFHYSPTGAACTASAINNWAVPRVTGDMSVPADLDHAMYFDIDGGFTDLGVPGEVSLGNDINDDGLIVGYSAIAGKPGGAVLWSGLVRIDLNDPLISDAAAQGWVLNSAFSINNLGLIVGVGSFGGNGNLPWVLIPHFKVIHFPLVEYQLPHFVWPDGWLQREQPVDWPEYLAFPLRNPSPFQLVGKAHAMLNELVKEEENNRSSTRERLIALLRGSIKNVT